MSAALSSTLAALLIVAIATDLRSRRIPNVLVAVGLGLGLAGRLLDPGSLAVEALITFFKGSGTGLLVLMPLYLMRACGAGDVKLMAMVGGFVGPAVVLDAALWTLVSGGVLSLVFMLGRGVAAQTIENIRFLLTDLMVRARSGGGARLAPLATTAARLPYAVAIAAGTLIAVLHAGPA